MDGIHRALLDRAFSYTFIYQSGSFFDVVFSGRTFWQHKDVLSPIDDFFVAFFQFTSSLVAVKLAKFRSLILARRTANFSGREGLKNLDSPAQDIEMNGIMRLLKSMTQ